MNEVYNLIDESSETHSETCNDVSDGNAERNGNDTSEKSCAIWNTQTISILLKLYEDELQILETPRKKTQIWVSISDSLKPFNIEMTPDQIRWKLNALTKKYKQCLDRGHHKFKYFKIMDKIFSQYCVEGGSSMLLRLLHSKKIPQRLNNISPYYFGQDANTTIEMRKIRLANRIEYDKSLGKIQLEKQWLEYLTRKEERNQLRSVIYENKLRLQEQKLQLLQKELEIMETSERNMIQLMEKGNNNVLHIEQEKCDLLKEMLNKT